jgi:hypothetical protein
MPLLGKAAMLLSFDVADEAIAEHDEWHTREHLPERLSVPGFLRGTRWVAVHGQPRYAVLYEVEQLDTLQSPAYLERLNQPTPWTSKMMPHYRGMVRGLCSVAASRGFGIGHVAALIRFSAAPGASSPLDDWLGGRLLPWLAQQPGLGSVHWLKGALNAQMTHEQRLRGIDAGVGQALLATGYSQAALQALAQGDLGADRFEAHGASDVTSAIYRIDYTLCANEIAA